MQDNSLAIKKGTAMKRQIILLAGGVLFVVFMLVGEAVCQSSGTNQAKFVILNLAENGQVIISAGKEDGASIGMKVTFFEKVPAYTKDGKAVDDLYPAGSSTIQRVGNYSSIVIADSALFHLLRRGFPVELPTESGNRVSEQKPEANTSPSKAVSQNAESTPEKRYNDTTVTALRLQTNQMAAGAAQQAAKPFDPWGHGFVHTPPASVTIYEALPITLYAPQPMHAPKLYYRVRGKIEYKEVDLTPKQNDFYFFEIPREEVAEPGIEYYLTVTVPSGDEVLAMGNPEAPASIGVSGLFINPQLELARHRGNRNVIRVLTEQVVFAGNDSYQHYEADYMYRIFTTLYSIRMGMGSFLGKGHTPGIQSVQTLNYYYGYTEAELALSGTHISVIGRFLTGINNNGIGSGFETKVRFGDELGVNLEAAVWNASQLGTSTSVQLSVPLSPRFGFSGNIAVENLPVQGDNGFRMAVDARYEVFPDLDVTGRLGMSARTTDFIGSNLGLGITRHF